MAIRIRNKLIFLRHPRTGSSATAAALCKIGGHKVGPGQHNFLEANKKEITACTIRDPYDVLATWYHMNQESFTSMEDFLLNYSHSEYMRQGRLFYFADVSDIWLLYDELQDRLNALLRMLKLEPQRIYRINCTSEKRPFMSYYSASDICIVEDKFSLDLEDYRTLRDA